MSDEWDFYFANVNDSIASLFLDLGIRDSVPDLSRPQLLWCWVYFRSPREDGLSSSEESPVLNEIEDVLTRAIHEEVGADFVGRITTSGRREFYFYGPTIDGFDFAVSQVRTNFPIYDFDNGTKDDPDWSHYFDVLLPTPEDFQRIGNRRVIETLQKNGDSLRLSRIVSHWAYFKTTEGRSTFIDQISQRGFQVVKDSLAHIPDKKLPFGVTIERADHVDWNSINDVTIELFQLAQNTGGKYDGWETSVEKDS